jgi:hypothetical protein
MKRVFVLTNGCYSDTRIVGVYSTAAKADIAAKVFSDDASVEEWDIDAMVSEMRRGLTPWFVRLNRDTGHTIECHEEKPAYTVCGVVVAEDIHRNIYTHCWATDREMAVKIASERRRVFLAQPQPVAEAQ